MDTLREFHDHVDDSMRNVLEGMENDDLGMAFRDGSFDDLHEIADQSVPVYSREIVNVCLDGSLLYEEPETGGATTPIQMMQFVLYDEALRRAYDFFKEYRNDEEDERRRFMEWLEQYGHNHEDCEEAYHAFRSPRDTQEIVIESEVYGEVWDDFKEAQ